MLRRIRFASMAVALATAVFTSATVAAEARKKPSTTKRASKVQKTEDLQQSFDRFCAEWMQKLREREQANLAGITWTPLPDGVVGTYVGYRQEHTCVLTDARPPVGRIRYEQVVYEKRGETIAAAMHTPPRTLERFDTLELFSFIKGQWDY